MPSQPTPWPPGVGAAPLRRWTAGCVIPFSLAFAIPGVACWIGALGMCFQATDARNWEEVGGHVTGVTDAAVEYGYRWKGITHAGQVRREGLSRTADAPVIGDRMLVWVNPRNPGASRAEPPQSSVVPLFLAIFALSHGGAGLGLLGSGIAGVRSERSRRRLEARWPDEPWKWREDWEQGGATMPRRRRRWLYAYLAVAWNSVAWWVAWLVWSDGVGPDEKDGIAFLALFVGLAPIWLAVNAFRFDRRIRNLLVRLPSRGLVPGETARLTFVEQDRALSAYRTADAGHTWTLRCVEQLVRSDGGESSVVTEERWSEDIPANRLSAHETDLTVRVPASALSTTSSERSSPGIRWELVGRDRSAGGGELVFLVPVFGGSGARDRAAAPAGDDPNPFVRAAGEEEVPPDGRPQAYAAEKIGVERSGDSWIYTFPPRRHAMPATTSLVLGIAFTGIGFIAVLPDLPTAPRMFVLFFGLIGLFLARSAVRQNFATTVVEVRPGRLTVTERVFGWTFVRRWAGTEIQSLTVKEAGSYNHVAFRVVGVKTASGREPGVTPLFAHAGTARALASEWMEIVRPPGE